MVLHYFTILLVMLILMLLLYDIAGDAHGAALFTILVVMLMAMHYCKILVVMLTVHY